MSKQKAKEKQFFMDYEVGEEFTRNNIKYRKVSTTHASTMAVHGIGTKETLRFFNESAKALPVSE